MGSKTNATYTVSCRACSWNWGPGGYFEAVAAQEAHKVKTRQAHETVVSAGEHAAN